MIKCCNCWTVNRDAPIQCHICNHEICNNCKVLLKRIVENEEGWINYYIYREWWTVPEGLIIEVLGG